MILIFYVRLAAQMISKVFPDPPVTPTQVKMLVEGMTGDSSPIRYDYLVVSGYVLHLREREREKRG